MNANTHKLLDVMVLFSIFDMSKIIIDSSYIENLEECQCTFTDLFILMHNDL